jgi:hypothetical protein
MADLITVPDLEQFTKATYADGDLLQVQFLIKYASAYVRRVVPSVDADLLSGDLDPDLLVGIVCQMIARALDAADAGSNVKRTVYPEVETEYFEGGLASAAASLLFLTDAEIELLSSALDSSTSSFSIQPG